MHDEPHVVAPHSPQFPPRATIVPDKVIMNDRSEEHYRKYIIAELLECIRTMPGMHFHGYDNGKDFHATVALSALQPFDFEKVWNYVHHLELLDYHLRFDNIATLRKEGEVWVVDRVFEVRGLI